jgi:L-aminopeptidase/D-esterase-like protein
MLKQKIIVPVVIVGSLLGGVAAGTAAYASSPSTPTAAATHPQSSQHPLHAWIRAHRRELRREGVAITAKTIGITPKTLVTDLRSGQSIAEVAGEHHVTAQTVVNAWNNAADSKINQAVTNHKLTSAQAQKIEARLPDRLSKTVNRVR